MVPNSSPCYQKVQGQQMCWNVGKYLQHVSHVLRLSSVCMKLFRDTNNTVHDTASNNHTIIEVKVILAVMK